MRARARVARGFRRLGCIGAFVSDAAVSPVAGAGRLYRAARTEPGGGRGAVGPLAGETAGDLASQRFGAAVVGAADLRAPAADALSARGLRHRFKSDPRGSISAGAARPSRRGDSDRD